jgi:hypothetical protein
MSIESELIKKKFWDYKILDATTSTYQCTLDWFERFFRYKKKVGESEYATKVHDGLDINAPWDWRYWTAMVRTRRVADTLGCRYDVFWEIGFTLIENYDSPYPIPNVFLNPNLLQSMSKAVMMDQEYRFARAEFFQPRNYKNKPLQNEYFMSVWNFFRDKPDVVRRLIANGKIPLDFFTNFKEGRLEGV